MDAVRSSFLRYSALGLRRRLPETEKPGLQELLRRWGAPFPVPGFQRESFGRAPGVLRRRRFAARPASRPKAKDVLVEVERAPERGFLGLVQFERGHPNSGARSEFAVEEARVPHGGLESGNEDLVDGLDASLLETAPSAAILPSDQHGDDDVSATGQDTLKARRTLEAGGRKYDYFSLDAVSEAGFGDISRLPASLKVLVENMLRYEDGRSVTVSDVEKVGLQPVHRGRGTGGEQTLQ